MKFFGNTHILRYLRSSGVAEEIFDIGGHMWHSLYIRFLEKSFDGQISIYVEKLAFIAT